MKNKKFVGTVMVPAMLHMFVFIVIPIVIGLVISFFNYNPLSSDNKFIGLENFVRLVQDADFRKALLNHHGYFEYRHRARCGADDLMV